MSDSTPPEPPSYGDQSYSGQSYGGQPGYGGQPSYGPPGAGGAVAPGSLMDRFLARLIDGVLLAVVGGIVVTAIVVGSIMGDSGGYGFSSGTDYAVSLVSAVLTTAIYLGYYVLLETQKGQTLGKMVMKLHVRGPDGANPTPIESVKRNWFMALPLLGIIPFLGGLIGSLIQLAAVIYVAVTINNDPVARRGQHDHLGDTTVVKQT